MSYLYNGILLSNKKNKQLINNMDESQIMLRFAGFCVFALKYISYLKICQNNFRLQLISFFFFFLKGFSLDCHESGGICNSILLLYSVKDIADLQLGFRTYQDRFIPGHLYPGARFLVSNTKYRSFTSFKLLAGTGLQLLQP